MASNDLNFNTKRYKSKARKIAGKSLFIVILLCFSLAYSVYANNDKGIRVLFLGNSVFYFQGGLYQSFEGFFREAGIECEAISQRIEPQNHHGITFLNYGRIPNSLPEVAADPKIHELIHSGKYDYVILEARREGHLLPSWVPRPPDSTYEAGAAIPYNENLQALQSLHQSIRASGAVMVLYMHPGSQHLSAWKNAITLLYQKIFQDLRARLPYDEQESIMLVPASLLWMDGEQKYGTEHWYADHIHGNAMARYASACMLYTWISGKNPQENPFRQLPRTWREDASAQTDLLAEEDAHWIKERVWLYYQMYSGNF